MRSDSNIMQNLPTPKNDADTTAASRSAPTDTPTAIDTIEMAANADFGLPSFWRHSPKQWFTYAEVIFDMMNKEQSDAARVNYVLAALDEESTRAVSDLGKTITYDALRARLIYAFTLSLAKRIQSIIAPGELADQAPTRLLRDMRHICPDDMGDATLGYFWLQKLPKSVRPIVAGLSGPLDAIAERADRILEASLSSELAADAAPERSLAAAVFPPSDVLDAIGPRTTDERLGALEDAVHSLSAQLAAFTANDAPPSAAPTESVW